MRTILYSGTPLVLINLPDLFTACSEGWSTDRRAWSEMSELFRSRAVEGRSVGN